jgi:MtrB/PioB family decaheme-associated outer membrane protein
VDENDLERSYQEVVHTRETTVWGRGTLRARDDLSLALRVAHGDRHRSTYGTATWFGAADNPLLRKFNLAARTRDSAGLRGDYTLGEKVSMGASVDYASDAYRDTLIGLKSARSVGLGLDVTASIGESAQVGAFGQAERQLSRQAGSSSFSVPDWQSENRDRSETLGVNVRYAAIPDKLDLGAELEWSRSHGDLTVSTPSVDPGFPAAAGTISRARFFGSYRLRSDLRLDASLLHQRLRSNDWHYDGVNPGTLPNLLALGNQSPNHDVSVVQLSLRYSF